MTGVGFAVIVMIYASVGIFAVVGSAVLTQRFLPVRWEQTFYGVFLAFIAGFYLAFVAYFEASDAWLSEGLVVAIFVLLALAGTRYLWPLVLGYLLHGVWDFVHELQAHGAIDLLPPDRITAIPLAYGIFCATFDIGIAGYALLRRNAWRPSPVSISTDGS